MNEIRLTRDAMMKYWKEIFQGYYFIYIRAYNAYSDWELEVAGIPCTGDPDYDNEMAMAIQSKQATIAEMAEYHCNDIKFKYHDGKYLPMIYKHIERYVDNAVEMFRMNHITEFRIGRSEELREYVSDLHKLVIYANSLRDAIGYVNWYEEQLNGTAKVKHSGRLLPYIDYIRSQTSGELNTDISIDLDPYRPSELALKLPGSAQPIKQSDVRMVRPWMRRQ